MANSLVSYTAPTDALTFYVSGLDSSDTAGTAGTFAGGSTAQGTVSYAGSVPITNVTAATAGTWFRFYTVTSNDTDTSTGNDIVGYKGSYSPTLTTIQASASAGGSGSSAEVGAIAAQKDFVDTLAEHVFGSREAADLLNNQAAVKSAWNTAEAAAVATANTSVDTSGDGATELANIAAASKELCENIMVNKYARFGLGYLASENSTTFYHTGGVTHAGMTPTNGTVVDGSNSGSGAKITVIMAADGDIQALMLHDAGDGNGPVTGSGYQIGDTLILTDVHASATDGVITIASLNSVQAAMLNGTLDDPATPTQVPLEAGDKIRVKFSINSAVGQLNAQGEAVSFTQSFFSDYTLQ